MSALPAVLRLPSTDRVQFERNFITTAVCELRFPTLLEFESNPPVVLAKRLRRFYPKYERQSSVSMGPGSVENEIRHVFRSKKSDWLVSFKSYAISLEVQSYTNFEDFKDRFAKLMELCEGLLDTDFFTRVGLRYIDSIPIQDGELSDWIRADLVGPLSDGTYGPVQQFVQVVRGTADCGQYTFRHGIEKVDLSAYMLDFDFWTENVEQAAVLGTLDKFNEQSYRFFCWSIGERARKLLGSTTSKGSQ